MKILEKFNLQPEEEALIKKVLLISVAVFIGLLVILGGLNYLEARKISAKIKESHIEKVTEEIDLETFYKRNSKNILPIDLEAHKQAALGDTSLKNKIHHLTRIISVEPNNYEMHLKLAEAYIEAGQYQKAENLFNEFMIIKKEKKESLPCNIESMYGLVLFYNGKFKQGHEKLISITSSSNACSESFCYLGQIEAAINRTEGKAEEYLKKALELDSTNIDAIYQLARYYMNRPDVDSTYYKIARKYLVEILAVEPLNVRAHSRLGMVYYYLDQPSLAEKSYLTALSLNNRDYNTRFNLGELYYTVYKDNQKALRQFKLALDLNPNHVDANFKSGLIMIENGQYKEAVNFLLTAHNNDPSFVRVLLQLAVAYEKLNLIDKAIDSYKKVLTLDELNDVALMKIRLLTNKTDG